jgi:lipoyl-dependent peroxiredoxin
MKTTAEVTLDQVADGFSITTVQLTFTAKIPARIGQSLRKSPQRRRRVVLYPKLLNTKFTLDATLA